MNIRKKFTFKKKEKDEKREREIFSKKKFKNYFKKKK